MHLHIEKAIKNCKFLEAIETHLPDDFFEWKITVVFYIAVHSVRALLKAKYKTYVGSSHKAIDNVIKSDGTYPFPLKQYRAYQALYVYSRDARYKVYDDTFGFNAKLIVIKLAESKDQLAVLEDYLKKEGILLSKKK